MTLAQKIVAAAERRGAPIDHKPGEINIIYVEGIDADGTPNRNRVNAFDDLRCVIDFVDGEPRVLGSWEATTAPGERYTKNPINSGGAAIIDLGYQRSWQVGMHPMSNPNHLALVQTGGPVRVARDKNKDFAREGDVVQSGYFGINQHWGYDQPKTDIGPASAGCLVGRTKDGHREFMKLVQSDPRYIADSAHIFGTTVVTAKDVMGDSPVAETGYRSLVGGFFGSPSQTDLPASIRFNNPGAVNAVAWNKALPGFAGSQIIGGGNEIAIYYTPEQGTAMWWELMRRYGNSGATTVGAIIDKYGGGQNYSAYKSFVVDKTGLSGDTEIDLDDDAQLLPFAKAMFWYEAGRATPLSDKQILYGFAYARAGFKEPVPEPIPEPIEGGTKPPPANMAEALARFDEAYAHLKETIRMAQQPAQIDWATILGPLAKELLPKLLPVLLPYIIQLLPQLLPLLLKGMSDKPAVSGTTVGAAGAGVGIGGLIGALITALMQGKVPQ